MDCEGSNFREWLQNEPALRHARMGYNEVLRINAVIAVEQEIDIHRPRPAGDDSNAA